MAGHDIKTKIKMTMRLFSRSQITMVMIIGIVILIAAGLLLYVSKNSGRKTKQDSIKEAQETSMEMQPIKDLVSGCLDKLSKDAVVLLGRQGGYIYKSQGGTFVDFLETDEGIFFISNNRANVAYNIKQISLVPQPFYSAVPLYPWPTFPYGISGSGQKTFKGLFGQNGMPPLNATNGPQSIQQQIESYVDSNMDKCLDFMPFEEQGYKIEKSKSRTTVTFGSSDVIIKSAIPIHALNTKTKESLQLRDFSTTLSIRLQDAYHFINNLIENDIGDITFSMKNPANSKNSFIVRVAENAFENDDIISVKDEKSVIYGQPFEYVFARKNRAPALYYISNTVLKFNPNYLIRQEDVLQDSELNAEDPDEDAVTLSVMAELPDPSMPTILDKPQIKFKVEANDGRLSDYQIITVNRI